MAPLALLDLMVVQDDLEVHPEVLEVPEEVIDAECALVGAEDVQASAVGRRLALVGASCEAGAALEAFRGSDLDRLFPYNAESYKRKIRKRKLKLTEHR